MQELFIAHPSAVVAIALEMGVLTEIPSDTLTTGFVDPVGVAFDTAGNFYVADDGASEGRNLFS